MTGSRPADITVKVSQTTAGGQVEFKTRRKGVPSLRIMLAGGGSLAEARKQLDQGLLGLKDAIPDLQAGDADLAEIYDTLHRIGRRLFFTLFGLRKDVIDGVQQFWNRAAPFGRNPEWPPLVESIGDKNSFLPLELLPLFRMDPGEPVSSRAQFVEGCRALVGFSCVVRRTMLPVSVHGRIELKPISTGRLPVRYLYVEELEGAQEELDWFSKVVGDRVDIEGPYPCLGTGAPGLAQQIFDPRMSLAGICRETPDQIQHFSCHCRTSLHDPFDNEIELSGNGHEIVMTLGTLTEDLLMLLARSPEREFDLPLVFMNSCGSARMQATSSLSFPYVFLQNQNRGFIGSEIEMPDDLAAVFSRALYTRFVVHKVPLGRSLLDARNMVLNEFRNPLIISYSSYADPDLHIGPAGKEKARDAADSVAN
jgi:hypothetical protein